MTDASLAVWAVLPVLSSMDALGRFAEWQRNGAQLFAPSLWVAESVSAIRRSVHLRAISREQGRVAIDDLFALGLDTLPMDRALSQSAFEWAARLEQARAYDGFYLALAENLGAAFWTADRRLANRAQQVGADWAHWIGEPEAAP